jgi:Na+/H+-dicarboxylate symporter
VRRALLTAFSTASSNATLPVTLEVSVTEGGCSKRATNFVIPIGATINMDGTALYEAVAALFLFQLFGVDLTFGDTVIVVMTATLAAIGAAGIPSAGLVTLVIVITAVNTSLAGRGLPPVPISAIGIIIGVDRLVDMLRTTMNVWGDVVGAKVITRLAPDEV